MRVPKTVVLTAAAIALGACASRRYTVEDIHDGSYVLRERNGDDASKQAADAVTFCNERGLEMIEVKRPPTELQEMTYGIWFRCVRKK
jgi:major membrane immunogen (membrane-anchored lipoprotein)